jgi:hypothetical protein
MTTRPRTLRDSIAITAEAAPANDSLSGESAAKEEAAEITRRGVLVRVAPETWRSLKLAALRRGTTVQAVMLEAIEVVLGRHEDAPAPDMQPRR